MCTNFEEQIEVEEQQGRGRERGEELRGKILQLHFEAEKEGIGRSSDWSLEKEEKEEGKNEMLMNW